MKENTILLKQARASLCGKWGLAIRTFVVYFLIMGTLNQISQHFLWFFIPVFLITGPMTLGASIFSLGVSTNKEVSLELLFSGFQNSLNAIKVYALISLYTFLWFCLLIVPGIIALISYSQVFYILAEDSNIGSMVAIDRSIEMMNGYKWKYFTLWVRMIGLALLCVLTLGIGFFWFFPYVNVVQAEFYLELKSMPGGKEGDTVVLE